MEVIIGVCFSLSKDKKPRKKLRKNVKSEPLTRLKVHITEFLKQESEVLWVFLSIRVTQIT